MARPQNLKRQRADDCSEEERPQKKPRERGTPWNYPPGFYDNLSKVWLTLTLRGLQDTVVQIFAIFEGQQNIVFTELHPITTDEATKPQPDFFDGARIHDLNKAIRDDDQIRPMIVPSKHRNVPVANNFFLEAKGPNGNAAVMERQACYDGAYGTRAIHSLENYSEEAPVYNSNARSFSSTYHAGTGTLQLYAHHATAPAAPAVSRTALPSYLNEDDQRDESQDSLSFGAADEQTSLVTSFTSSFRSGTASNSRVHSKRNRASNSPPVSHQKKSRGSERNKVDQEKGKGRASSSNIPDDNDWEWDAKMEAYKSWNKDRWEYWDEERQARKYYDGKKWRWLLAAASVGQGIEDVTDFSKLAEGGFNRTFLVTMRDGSQLVARIPYPVVEPKSLVIASEVATMDFLRSRGIPVPKVYGYSTTSENAAGTEYIFMELARGTNLGDIWYAMSEKARIAIVTKIVHLESQLFALRFPANHLDSLNRYLRIAPYLVPDDTLSRPVMRHPDLQPNNVFVSDDGRLEITGLIDWQNYNFDQLEEREQYGQVELLRKRQLHYYYIKATAELNLTHYNALAHDFSILRRKLYHHASDPWEGDNVTLKADLIQLTQNWAKIASSPSCGSSGSMDADNAPPCPITFSEPEVKQCLQLYSAQVEADEQFTECRDAIGVGPEGWVPPDQYEDAKQREDKLKADALGSAESEDERAKLIEHWIFDDFNEEEYS
ncbi:hypothetical protein DV735_g1155, partial [Chaetothyriales sp. CBS 134920]